MGVVANNGEESLYESSDVTDVCTEAYTHPLPYYGLV